MAGYRLVEYGGGTRGANTWPAVYGDVLEAVEVGEKVMAALADRPHRRPFRVDVVDVWTRETVTSVRLGVDRDPAVCPACGAPDDPFAVVPLGGTPTGAGVNPSPPAPVELEEEARGGI